MTAGEHNLLFSLFPDPRQSQPKEPYRSDERQDYWLQDLHALGLSNDANDKRKDGTARATKRCGKANATDVQVSWQEFGASNDCGGKHGTQEETLKTDRHGGDVELRNKPEDELEGHGQGKVDL